MLNRRNLLERMPVVSLASHGGAANLPLFRDKAGEAGTKATGFGR